MRCSCSTRVGSSSADARTKASTTSAVAVAATSAAASGATSKRQARIRTDHRPARARHDAELAQLRSAGTGPRFGHAYFLSRGSSGAIGSPFSTAPGEGAAGGGGTSGVPAGFVGVGIISCGGAAWLYGAFGPP